LGFALIMAAVLFMFFQFTGIMTYQRKFSSDFYGNYIDNLNTSLLLNMSRYIENHYPVLRDTDLLKQEAAAWKASSGTAGAGWFWDIADEWLKLADTFNFEYIYYIEKNFYNDNYIFLMSSGIRRNKNPEWLGGPVWEGKPPAFVDEAWETKQITFSPEPTVNEWGTLVSIEHPVIADGRVVGILGIDYDISFINRLQDHELELKKQETEAENRVIIIFVSTIVIVIAIIIYLLWVSKTSVMVSVKEKEAERLAIIAGMEYANNIQKNLLPMDAEMKKAFSDYSVIWEPRDIVSGDIYWMKRFDEGTVLCVCDCTGHGTSGALLTMLVISALETAVKPHNCRDTAETIWRLEQRLVDVFGVKSGKHETNDADIQDGCDLAVLFMAKDGSVALSAGNTNVFVCDGKTVQRFKGQKIFVGEGKLNKKDDVETINIPAAASNKFYIASDGLFDQPGGANSRPLGYKAFEKIILDHHGETQGAISAKIWADFEKYRDNEPRVDDFTLFTFKP
jgi:hypothetical protein